MYHAFSNLQRDPFGLVPDCAFRYPHRGYRNVLARLEEALEGEAQLLAITGLPGVGKTLMLHELRARLLDREAVCVKMASSRLEPRDLLCAFAQELGVSCQGAGLADLLGRLETHLRTRRQRCVLAIDEAHELCFGSLAVVVALCARVGGGARPWLQILLAGAPEVAAPLGQIASVCELQVLDEQETALYIQHRLRCAGWQGDPRLTPGALRAVYRLSKGVPRSVNLLCRRVMLLGIAEGLHEFDAPEVHAAWMQLQDEEMVVPVPVAPAAIARLRMPGARRVAAVHVSVRSAPALRARRHKRCLHDPGCGSAEGRAGVQSGEAGVTAAAAPARSAHSSGRQTVRYVGGSAFLGIALMAAVWVTDMQGVHRNLLASPEVGSGATNIDAGTIWRTPPAGVGKHEWNTDRRAMLNYETWASGNAIRQPAGAGGSPGLTGPRRAQASAHKAQPFATGPHAAPRSAAARTTAVPSGMILTLARADPARAPAQQSVPAHTPAAATTPGESLRADPATAFAQGVPRAWPGRPASQAAGAGFGLRLRLVDTRAQLPESSPLPRPSRGMLPDVERPQLRAALRSNGKSAQPHSEPAMAQRAPKRASQDAATWAPRPQTTALLDSAMIEAIAPGEPHRPSTLTRPETGIPKLAGAASPSRGAGPAASRPQSRRSVMVPPADLASQQLTRVEAPRPQAPRPQAARTEVGRAGISRPEPACAEVGRPEVTRPRVARLELTRPEVTRPESSRPEIARVEVVRPETVRPQLTRPEVHHPMVESPAGDRTTAAEPS